MPIAKWFTTNLSDAQAMKHPTIGLAYLFGYPVNETAGRYGASVERETDSQQDAWEQVGWSFADFEPAPLPWPPE